MDAERFCNSNWYLRLLTPFRIFLASQTALTLGDAIRKVIAPLMVLQLTHSALLVAVIALLETIPFVVLQLSFGVLLDRWNRRRVMIWADVGRAGLVLAVPLTDAVHGPTLAVLFLVAAPLGALSSLFDAGSGAILPALVPASDQARAYGVFESGESLSWVLGPAVAGIIAGMFRPADALVVDGLSFIGSAAGLLAIRLPPAGPLALTTLRLWRDMLDGLRLMLRTPELRSIQAAWTLYGLIGYGAVMGLVFVGSAGKGGLSSAAVSAYAAGSIVGTLLTGRSAPQPRSLAPAVSLVLVGFGALLVAGENRLSVLAGAIAIGGGEGFLLVVYLTLRAKLVPDGYMGRIVSVARLLAGMATSLSVAWIGLLLARFGGQGTFLAMAASALAAASGLALLRRSFTR